MKPIDFKLEKWSLNQSFNRIKNCRVVQPPYEKAWYYSNKFFLDKRLGLQLFTSLTNRHIVDEAIINWVRYYLVHYYEFNMWYIYALDWTSLVNVTPDWFWITSDSPKKICIGKWIYWPRNSIWRLIESPESWTADWTQPWWTLTPSYSWWYIKFKYSWVQNIAIWDYILWKVWALKWWINRVEYYDQATDTVYVIWTNTRWTIPQVWDAFDLYKAKDIDLNTIVNEWNTIVFWWRYWLDLIILNWINVATSIPILTTTSAYPILDLTNFDWNIFALTSNAIYFSRTTYEDNTQFYPLDRFNIVNGKKIFSIWKALLLFWQTNKIYSSINLWWDQTYAWYDVNYQWELYSKYSCIFADQTIYILQKDKQLKQIDIIQYNTTSYDLKVSDVLTSTVWLFNWIEAWWDVYINSDQRYLNFLYVKDWKTINYQYDKMYQHFIENYYNYTLYKLTDHILSIWKIFVENWYTDELVEYNQEVNMLIDTWMTIYKPYILRTIFWLTNNLFEVNLWIEFELWWTINTIDKVLDNFEFDNRFNTNIIWDELLEQSKESTKFNWNIVSIQSNLMKWWRFIRLKYYSQNRFMIWDSFIITDETKPYINEPLLTN